MRLLVVWLLILSLTASHIMEINDLVCSTSSKKSADITNCSFGGRYINSQVNFIRPLDDWKVSKIFLRNSRVISYVLTPKNYFSNII